MKWRSKCLSMVSAKMANRNIALLKPLTSTSTSKIKMVGDSLSSAFYFYFYEKNVVPLEMHMNMRDSSLALQGSGSILLSDAQFLTKRRWNNLDVVFCEDSNIFLLLLVGISFILFLIVCLCYFQFSALDVFFALKNVVCQFGHSTQLESSNK